MWISQNAPVILLLLNYVWRSHQLQIILVLFSMIRRMCSKKQNLWSEEMAGNVGGACSLKFHRQCVDVLFTRRAAGLSSGWASVVPPNPIWWKNPAEQRTMCPAFASFTPFSKLLSCVIYPPPPPPSSLLRLHTFRYSAGRLPLSSLISRCPWQRHLCQAGMYGKAGVSGRMLHPPGQSGRTG